MWRFCFFDCAPVTFFPEAATTTTATTEITVSAAKTLLFMWGINFVVWVFVAYFALAFTTTGTPENRVAITTATAASTPKTRAATATAASTFILFLFNWLFFFNLSFLKLQVEVEGI